MKKYFYEGLIILLSAIFFMPFLGAVHLFDWDEINFAEAAREMLTTQNFGRVHINYVPFWEKPPLFLWLQALSMHFLGVGEYAARLPNALCGIFSLLVLFRIGQKLYNSFFGLLWAALYMASILPHFYFKTGIIDPIFNLFIFLGIYFLMCFYWKKNNFSNVFLSQKKYWYLFVSGFFIGLAVLTKGPVAYLIFCLCVGVYFMLKKFHFFISIPEFLALSVVVAVVASAWFALEIYENGWWFLVEFVKYQYRLFSTPDAGHRGFLGYHFVVLFLGCFPASIFALESLFPQKQNFAYQQNFKTFMMILFWVVLILFSIVKSKIVHYSSLAYFPVTFLGALSIYRLLNGQMLFKNYFKWLFGVVAFLVAFLILALPWVGINIGKVRALVKDEFAQKNMEAVVVWTNFDFIYGIFALILFGIIFWSFHQNKLERAFALLLCGMPMVIAMTLGFFPRIERYTQGAAVDFFKQQAQKDVYVATVGYKSYAHLFYAKVKPAPRNLEKYNGEWADYVLAEDLDKDCYISVKCTELEAIKGISRLEKIGEKNGFVFFIRRKK